MYRNGIALRFWSLCTAVFFSHLLVGTASATSINFTDGAARGLSNFDLAGDAWLDQGVSFTGMRWYGSGCGIGPACLYESNLDSEMSMTFTLDVNSVGFLFSNPTPRGAGQSVTISAYNDGSFVTSLSRENQLGGWLFALSGVGLIDKIIITGESSGWNLGSLEFSQVPIPAAAWLFGSAIIGLAGLAARKA